MTLVEVMLVVVGEAVRAAEVSSAAPSTRIASRLRPTTATFPLLLPLLLLPVLGRFAGCAWSSLFDSGCALRAVDRIMGADLTSFFLSLSLAAFFLRVA